jgi:hypothetical protein
MLPSTRRNIQEKNRTWTVDENNTIARRFIEVVWNEGPSTRVTIRGVDGVWTGNGNNRVQEGKIVEQWANISRIA